MSEPLNTANAVVIALGGTHAVAELTGRSDPAVSNWRKANSFPANTYFVLKAALCARTIDASDSLWSITKPAELAS